MQQLAAAARLTYSDYARIGVDRSSFAGSLMRWCTAWCWLKSRIVEIAAAAAIIGCSAMMRCCVPAGGGCSTGFIGGVLSCMALLLAFAGVIILEVMVTHL